MSVEGPLSYFHDPGCREYQFRWQAEFSKRRRALGPYAAHGAQRYVSELRAMQRLLNAGGKPSLRDFPSFGHVRRDDFIENRKFQHLRRAINRGEKQRSLARRGFFGSLKEYRTRHCS